MKSIRAVWGVLFLFSVLALIAPCMGQTQYPYPYPLAGTKPKSDGSSERVPVYRLYNGALATAEDIDAIRDNITYSAANSPAFVKFSDGSIYDLRKMLSVRDGLIPQTNDPASDNIHTNIVIVIDGGYRVQGIASNGCCVTLLHTPSMHIDKDLFVVGLRGRINMHYHDVIMVRAIGVYNYIHEDGLSTSIPKFEMGNLCTREEYMRRTQLPALLDAYKKTHPELTN